MERYFHSLKRKLPTKKESLGALATFTSLERLFFVVALIIAFLTSLSIVSGVNNHFMVHIPAEGGTLREGVIGTPRFVNPLLATSDIDHDLSLLVYRGLVRIDEEGELVPDLAESYEVSEDKRTYTFTLKNAQFHDGVPVTSDDVVFTVHAVQDPLLKSARKVEWEGVTATAIDEKTVTFTLKNPYSPFLKSTRLGIMPKHIWGNIPYDSWSYSDYNTDNAVGSGPYKVVNVTQNSSGIPESYELNLVRSDREILIQRIVFKFYANEESLVSGYEKGEVDAIGGVSPEKALELSKKSSRIMTTPLPRIFGLFFNQAQSSVLSDSHVRKAIGEAINKEEVVEQILLGYGHIATGPFSEGTETISGQTDGEYNNAQAARDILEKAGWDMGEDGIYHKKDVRLSFEIATNNVIELTKTVEILSAQLRNAGIEAVAKVYETGSLNQDIIRPRKFESLFFGTIVGGPSDLFAFWHSSQRNDPGLNISGYTNSRVDKLLESSLQTLDPQEQGSFYEDIKNEITTDMPAVFTYSPSFIYIVRSNMPGIVLGRIESARDRFNGIDKWYLATDRVWKIFAH